MVRDRGMQRAKQRGISLPELLVVISILALGVIVIVPTVSKRLSEARVQSAVGQFVTSLRAVRMIAVTSGLQAKMTIDVADNSYGYLDSTGHPREFRLPDGMKIVSSPPDITFQTNGGVPAAATTVIEAVLVVAPQDRLEIRVPVSGIPEVVQTGPSLPIP